MSRTADNDDIRRAISLFASNVTIVTTSDGGAPHGCTATAWAESADPAMVLTTLRSSSRTLERMQRAGFFGLSVLAAGQEHLVARFAGPEARRFDGIAWSVGSTGAPLLDGCLAALDCLVDGIHPFGAYRIVTGKVVSARVEEGRAPLVHFDGAVSVPSEGGLRVGPPR